jgi:hypothetical protein
MLDFFNHQSKEEIMASYIEGALIKDEKGYKAWKELKRKYYKPQNK